MEQEEDKDEPTVERAQKGLGIHICDKCGHLHLRNHSVSQCSGGQLKNVGYFEAFGSAEFMVIACLVVHREWHLSTPYHCPVCYKGHPNHDCGYYFCHGVFDIGAPSVLIGTWTRSLLNVKKRRGQGLEG